MLAAAPINSVSLENAADSAFARDVQLGLTQPGQKTLPASWLYDEVGSALFEVITVLPEYGLTRADNRLLQENARNIVEGAGRPSLVIELGSGSGTKTRHLLRAAASSGQVTYRPIDISSAALHACADSFSNMPGVRVDPIEATYEDGLLSAMCSRAPGEKALVLFLGSTIGNFSRQEAVDFLGKLRRILRPGDMFLLGADLVKDRRTLLLAYDDPAGITAAFNKNLLGRMNRELASNFDLSLFTHQAKYNEKWSRIEMHLRSDVAQTVHIGALGVDVAFRPGETIWTESSHKFKAEEIQHMGEETGWHCRNQWIDREWGFAETLFAA